MDDRLWRTFVDLAETNHFGATAVRLGVTQSAVSQQLGRLEAAVGVRLLERSPVGLTEAGRAALPPARRAVRAADAAAAAARRPSAAVGLRFGFSPGAHYVAERVLGAFLSGDPAAAVETRQDNTGVLAELVAAGELDLALGFAHADGPRVTRTHLWEERAVLAVAVSHPLAVRRRVALTELAEERFALVDAHSGPGYNQAVIALCRQAGFTPRTEAAPRGPMAWESAVRSGRCVGLTTRLSTVSTARGVRLVGVEPAVGFALTLLRGDALSAPAARLAALLERPDPE